MWPKVLIFLTGIVYIHYMVLADDVYIAELMVESNVTLDSQTILSILDSTTSLQVDDSQGVTHTVTLLQNQLVAECLIIGATTSCNCSTGYTWSNDVCYNFSCCSATPCTANVSNMTPLCIPIVNVQIYGSVILSSGSWDSTKTAQLQQALQGLNGFQYLNITDQRQSNSIVDFVAGVSVKFATSRLQGIVTSLENSLAAVVLVNTFGIVTIVSPNTTVCYESSPQLKCTFEEPTDSSGWNMSMMGQRYELNNGSVVQLDTSCATPKYQSCIGLTLNNVKGSWTGIYECGFTTGSVRHAATAQLSVALLPDVITMVISPLTGDCSNKKSTDSVSINVTTTIPQSTENYDVWWSYRDEWKASLYSTSTTDGLVYTFTADFSCQTTTVAQYVSITFKNMKGQEKSARVDIPVIYEGSSFCSQDVIDGDLWPKTPAGATVINRTCSDVTIGYKSGTCIGPAWQPIFLYCIDQQLNKVSNQAFDFLQGLGATEDVAIDIFQRLENSSASPSTNNIADISASISVLNIMARASSNIALQDEVLPNLINAASNLLNKSWDAVNNSVLYNMSSTYLQSVEGLVKNIKVNNSDGVNSTNLELKFCSGSNCNVSVFDIGVNMNITNGTLKTLAVKNLTDKLRNIYSTMEPTNLLVSATLENNNDSSLEIKLDFPYEQLNNTKPFCVFWNTTEENWSEAGCIVNASDANHTWCECNHLTPFSVLMSKGDKLPEYDQILDIITNVGLGVSVCSLLIFLTVEYLVWSAVVKSNLSHFRHTAMVNIAMFLLLADCSFLASTSPSILSDNWCLIFTICKHLFYLAMFCWMLCMSVMLVHQLIFVFSPLRKRVFMFFSSIVGYVCPILIVGSSYVYYKYTNEPYYDTKTCWLHYERLLVGSMHAFLLPVGTVTLTNVFCMMVVIVTLVKSSVPDGSKADDKETAKSIMKVVLFLTPVFGVTWIIGFFQMMLSQDNPMYPVACFSFTILNSFQGLFILVTGCFAEQKVREELFKLIKAKSKGQSDSMKNLTSTTYTKDK